ncbi:MAG: polymorphic toxin-type HINT domain-containing protein [Actinomycetota bacterium]
MCGLNSFAGETEVLLASGDRVAIADVVVGDVVWATDPVSGVSAGRAVTAVWPHEDWLIELDTSHGVVVTTEDHHFWNATDQAWQETREFDAGDRLVTTDGVTVTVYGLDEQTWRYGDAFDLTVDDLPTYYVTTSDDVPVLVHNTDCGPDVQLQLFDDDAYVSAGRRYTVEAEAMLSPDSYRRSRQAHNADANATLHAQVVADPVLAARLESTYPGITSKLAPSTRGRYSRSTPHRQLTWHHHPTVPGLMQLVPRVQHTPSIHLQGNRGGWWVWGGGRR